MSFTAAERVKIKSYMGDFSAEREAAIVVAEATSAIETEVRAHLATLATMEVALSSARSTALVSQDGKTQLSATRSLRVIGVEGKRVCDMIGDLLLLAPVRDIFENDAATAGIDSDELRGW